MRSVVAALGALGILLIFLGVTAPASPSRVSAVASRLGREAGYPRLRSPHLTGLCVFAGILSLVLSATMTSSVIVVGVLGVAAACAPLSWLRGRARRRRRAHREVWPETIAVIASGARAGVSLPEVVCGLADRGPEVLRPHFYSFRATYRATNSFAAALTYIREVLADPIADRVIEALHLSHEVGGTDLVRVLNALGDFVRDDIRTRKEIEARWSWTVTAARLAAAAPWLVLLAMSSRPEAASAYDSSGGALLIAGGALSTLVGYRLMLRAARLPEEPRWAG